MIHVSGSAGLVEGILRTYQVYYCQGLPRMEVVNSIKQVFVELNLVKGLKKNHKVKVIINGLVSTMIKNNQLGLISELNLRRLGLMEIPLEYETHVYYSVATVS